MTNMTALEALRKELKWAQKKVDVSWRIHWACPENTLRRVETYGIVHAYTKTLEHLERIIKKLEKSKQQD